MPVALHKVGHDGFASVSQHFRPCRVERGEQAFMQSGRVSCKVAHAPAMVAHLINGAACRMESVSGASRTATAARAMMPVQVINGLDWNYVPCVMIRKQVRR